MFVKNHIFTFWPWNWLFCDLGLKLTLQMTLNQRFKGIIHTKSYEKEVLHISLALFVKTYILSYLTLKLTFWPWRWPWIIKIVSEMDCPVKITWKWGITFVPSFISWKIICVLEIDLSPWIYKLFKLALIGFEVSTKQSIRNIKKHCICSKTRLGHYIITNVK